LSSLPDNHDDLEVVLKQGSEGECEISKDNKITMVTSPQHKNGRKIPTIVNGRVFNIDINENDGNEGLTRLTNNQIRTHRQRSTKFTHNVEILGDSHLIGSAAAINQNLDTNFKVCSLIQPGACTKQIVDSQEVILESLGKSDVIVINGGTNDIDEYNGRVNGILNLMVHFVQKYNNTNIVLVNIPLWKLDKRNLCIQDYNNKLKNISKIFKHVSLVEISSNWRLFTRQGLHLNRFGKEWLAKQIALQIELLVKLSSKVRPVINLKWKEELTNLNNDNILLITETNNVEDLVPATQSLSNLGNGENNGLESWTNTMNERTNEEVTTHLNNGNSMMTTVKNVVFGPSPSVRSPKNQCNGNNNEETRRISTKNKKVPSTMSNDFLW